MKSKEGSPFVEMESSPAWKEHAAGFDADFARYQQQRTPAIRDFQTSELTGASFDKANLFYPFGGPDFLNAQLFFPGREAYVFIGLEPPGTVPTFKQFAGQNMASQLPRMRRTLHSLLTNSYFQTLEMAAQIKAQVTDGLLPIMLVQMARTGYTIEGWSPITINDEGIVMKPEDVPAPPPPPPPAPGKKAPAPRPRTPGYVIEFQKEGSTKTQRLYYFSTDVIDPSIKRNEPFLQFLPRMKPFDTYYKAASYLSHRDTFSVLRGKVLELAVAVVEDDSGIPYRFFDREVWDITLYGSYAAPIAIFAARIQPDLKTAYTNGSVPVKKLDFGIGYSVTKVRSNLLVAKRKTL